MVLNRIMPGDAISNRSATDGSNSVNMGISFISETIILPRMPVKMPAKIALPILDAKKPAVTPPIKNSCLATKEAATVTMTPANTATKKLATVVNFTKFIKFTFPSNGCYVV
ncbi:MAG: hypothetical protein QW196_05655 [Sulfolobales archaeon]